MTRAKHLAQYRQQNLDLLKNQFFRDIISGVFETSSEIEERLLEIETNLERKNVIRLILLEFDAWGSQKRKTALKEMISFVTASIVRAVSLSQDDYETVKLGEGELLILLGSDTSVDDQRIAETFIEVRERVSDTLSCTMSAAVSPEAYQIDHLSELYEQTRELLNYRLVFGPDLLITEDVVSEYVRETVPFPISDERKLLDAIKQNDERLCRELYRTISDIISHFRFENIILGYTRLASSVFDHLNTIEVCGAGSCPVRFTEFTKQLGQCTHVTEIDELFENLFEVSIQLIRNGTSQKTRSNVEFAARIIESEYSDASLNSQLIASRISMSPIYLGRIFREITGVSMSAYLTGTRLEASQKILLEDGASIKEISKRVGFPNTRYFFTKFKERYGVTPSQFRSRSARDTVR
jgi:AraC-like DNA-binding protein